ncbi:hypothetical protein LOTGIDRAFT_173072 [Lottia gigantea]|uniref:Uncharacterized protein n=1 Tax=Lottia gigantea TaxID=225164 RepID=V4A9X5_LOTGI|nr:hypothetical protein LOTGIDRAFT_173072 [Lottia gigantea]ESP00799.1 hypothetical protein LOTGIDRAFT_173072 [Lottia gigantea]
MGCKSGHFIIWYVKDIKEKFIFFVISREIRKISEGSEANRDVIDRVNERLARRRKEREEKRMLETESDAPAEEETSSRRSRRRQSEDEKPAEESARSRRRRQQEEEAPAAEEEAPAEAEEDDSGAREAEERRRQQDEEEEEERRQAAEERRRQEDERRRQKEEEEREAEEERRRQEECAFFDLIYGCDETESAPKNQLDSEIIEKYETLDKTIAKRRNTLVQEGSIEISSDNSFSYQADTEGHCMDTDTADLTENEAFEYPRAKVSRILTNVRKIPQSVCTSDTESYDLDKHEKRYTRKVKSPHSENGRETPMMFYSDSENTDTMEELEFDQTYTEKTFQNRREAEDKPVSASVKPEGVDVDDISEGSSVFIHEEESTSSELNNNVTKTPTQSKTELLKVESECPVPRLDLDMDSKSKSSSESDSGPQLALGEGIGSRMKSVQNLLELDFNDGRTNSESTYESDSLSRKGSNSSNENRPNQDSEDALSRKGSNSSGENKSNHDAADALSRKGSNSSGENKSNHDAADALSRKGSNSSGENKTNQDAARSLIRQGSSSSIGTKLNSKISSIYSDYRTDYCERSPRSNQKQSQPPKTAPKPKQAPKPAPKPRKHFQVPDSSCSSPRGNLSPRKNGGYVPALVTKETIQATNMCKYSPRKQIDKWKMPVSESQTTKKSGTLSSSKINKIREQLTQSDIKLSPRPRPLSADRGRTFIEMKAREEEKKRKEAEEKKNKMNNSVLALIADRKKYFNNGTSYKSFEDHSLRHSVDNSKKDYCHKRDESQRQSKHNSNTIKDNSLCESFKNSKKTYSKQSNGTRDPSKSSNDIGMEDNSLRDSVDNSKRVSSQKREDLPKYLQSDLKSSEILKVKSTGTNPHEPRTILSPRISSPRVSGLRSDRSEPIVSPRGVPLRAVHNEISDKRFKDIPSPRQSRSQYRSHGDSIREELRSRHNVVDIKGWREFKSEYGNYRRVSRVEFSSDSESEKPEKSNLRKSGKTSKSNDSKSSLSLSGDQSLMKKISSFQNRIIEIDLDNSKHNSPNQSRSFLSESSSPYSPRYRSSSHDGRISYLKNKLETSFESANTKPSSSRNSSSQRADNSKSDLDYLDSTYIKPVRDNSASRRNRLYTSTDYLTSNQKEGIDSSERQKRIDIKGINRRLNSVNVSHYYYIFL